jgi:hypothetical protein
MTTTGVTICGALIGVFIALLICPISMSNRKTNVTVFVAGVAGALIAWGVR